MQPNADGLQRLAEGLGAGALPAMAALYLNEVHVGDAGASALSAAMGRGALLRLKSLILSNATVGDTGMVALAPALRCLPELTYLSLIGNQIGDEGLAALVAPSPPTGGLKKLKQLNLGFTEVSDAGCAALAAALNSGTLPALKVLHLTGCPASAASIADVHEALALAESRRRAARERETAQMAAVLGMQLLMSMPMAGMPSGVMPNYFEIGGLLIPSLGQPGGLQNLPQLGLQPTRLARLPPHVQLQQA